MRTPYTQMKMGHQTDYWSIHAMMGTADHGKMPKMQDRDGGQTTYTPLQGTRSKTTMAGQCQKTKDMDEGPRNRTYDMGSTLTKFGGMGTGTTTATRVFIDTI